ncbi:MAG TPA: DUF4185 domain-containing protein [Chloroflexia bacterium]|nr:DUF4185 domain-containing protein [Chloroflexia bacterium]
MKPNTVRNLLLVLGGVIVAGGAVAVAAWRNQAGGTDVVPAESTFFSTAAVEETSTYNTDSDGDLWPVAWSDDDYLYGANGDGKGFDLGAQWADIVVNRIAGDPAARDVTGTRLASGDQVGQVWSDPAKYNRKPTGLISVGGVLYLAVQDLRSEQGNVTFNDVPAATIVKSTDKGKTWTWDKTKPMFDQYLFTTIMFLDYGKDGANNTFDTYVYAYGLDNNWRDSFSDTVPDPTKLFLARVPKDGIQDRQRWEFYAGDLAGQAKWTADIKARQPVLQDDRRVYPKTLAGAAPNNMTVISQGSIVYNKPLNRYIYTSWTEYTFEFYEAPAPWGPWRRFLSKDFGTYPWFQSVHGGYGTVIPSKFISADGRDMWFNSNTFVGGIKNYSLSFRKLHVTPYVATMPANAPGADNLALPDHGQDVTPISRARFRFGRDASLNNGDLQETVDSKSGEAKTEDFWGYTWSRAYNMNKVVYTTGAIDPNDGGWFDDLRVQVRQNFRWVDVPSVTVTPPYPHNAQAGANTSYTFHFADTWGDGVRIIGTPGGPSKFTSFAELAVYYSH